MKDLDYTEIKKSPDDKNYDKLVFLLNSVCGFIPSVGTAIAESIKYFIPNDREERVINFIQDLAKLTNEHNKRIDSMEEKIDFFDKLNISKYNRRLLEIGIQNAADLSDDKIREIFISSFYKIALINKDEDNDAERKLKIISELSFSEIIILIHFYEPMPFIQSEFKKKWTSVLNDKYTEMIINSLITKGLVTKKQEVHNKTLGTYDRITKYGEEIVNIIYDEKLFGKINKFPF